MKKTLKTCITLAIITCSCCFFACSKEDLRGFADAYFDAEDARANGFTYVGTAKSQSKCENMCADRDYSMYRYNPTTNSCYCK